jgi:hypothetical protein
MIDARKKPSSPEPKFPLEFSLLPFHEMDQLIPWFISKGGAVDTGYFGLAQFPGQGWGAIALKDIPV